MDQIGLVVLDEVTLEAEGSYCLRSKPGSPGYTGKNEWLETCFQKGLQYVKLTENGKTAGFIEYTPIEHSSRVVYGENYFIIHCLWIGATEKGYASRLIRKCIEDAKALGKDGVAVITNSTTSWTPSKEIYIKNGFRQADQAPYGFELMVYPLGHRDVPCFPNNWNERLNLFPDLTILRTPQCPYLTIATDNMITAADKLGLHAEIVNMKNREELLKLSPTPYGVYGVVYKQKLIAYHRLTVHSPMKRLKGML